MGTEKKPQLKPNDFCVIFKIFFFFLVLLYLFQLDFLLVNAADLVLIFHVKMNEKKELYQ